MRLNVIAKFLTFCFLVWISLDGNGGSVGDTFFNVPEPVKEASENAKDIVREFLDKKGLKIGYNPDRKAIVSIGTHSIDIKHPSKELTEEQRFEAFDAAYLQAIGKISIDISDSVHVVKSSVMEGTTEEKSEEMTRMGMNSVFGPKIITQAEGWSQRDGYMVAVAVVKSEKAEQVARFMLKGEFDKLPKFTQAEDTSVEEFLKKSIRIL